MGNDKRFLEETFPVKEVSIESAREKNIRHGHISTLHIWWARRPLASSRATNYAALIPASNNIEEWNQRRQFISGFSRWENSLNQTMIDKARKDILKANGGKPPRVLDPFGGGGAIPLEALRLGCEVYSNDYNPVSVLIQKCTLEYPQRYGKSVRIKTDSQYPWGETKDDAVNPLLEDVKRWGTWVLEEAKKEIKRFYPAEADGFIPVGYIWARTIPCQNPLCEAEMPLMRQFWLAKKAKKRVSLLPYVEGKRVKFKIVGDRYEKAPSDFDPAKGTVSRAIATCPVCGAMVDANTTRRLFQEGKAGQRMVAVVLHKPGQNGKRYRVATEKDMEIFKEAERYLEEKRSKLMDEWGIDPVPDEPLVRVPVTFGVINVWVYGMNAWGDLFNSRQKLALITFAEKVRQAHREMLRKGYDEEYAKAVGSYLGLGLSRMSDYSNALCIWDKGQERTVHVFGRQALPMVWDYSELNPLSSTVGSWESMAFRRIWKVIKTISYISPIEAENFVPVVKQSSATSLHHPDNYFDAVFTDPPYYDNVPYSYLSDFFYVWLKRTVGDLYPELFSTPLTPKKNEIVAYSNGPGGWEDGKAFFEDMLKKSFQEIHRVLKPNGIAVIVYAHKSTAGWETLINSLLDSGLIMTAAWPVNTEMQSRLRAQESATLASSIYIVARKIDRQSTGFYNDVNEELKRYLSKKLEHLWEEGISGADFFIAAIGSAIEVFGKYEKVIDHEGKPVRADRMLDDVRKIVTDYAVKQVLHNGFSGEISDMTRFYVLWRWSYKTARVIFDDARKLAQSCSIDIADEWNRPGFIKKDKEFVKVLGPTDRDLSGIKGSRELIDVLHGSLLLWREGRHDEMMNLLKKSGLGDNDTFYRVAQAISETLPDDSDEKKLLDVFLRGKERLREGIRGSKQGRLF